jgi:hypothetical protein
MSLEAGHKLIKKTIITQSENVYSSFPTFIEYSDKIFIFYRQGMRSDRQCHGILGKVKCFEIDKNLFTKAFNNRKLKNLYHLGYEYVVFEEGNEHDAIISQLDENAFSLATRTYIKRQWKTYISFADKPVFKERCEVKIRGIKWLSFYGKGFKWKEGYIFPSYGQLKGEDFARPLIVITSDFSNFDILSYLPSNINGAILNESSVVFDGMRFVIFMRDDIPPFGIWYSTSDDLQNWRFPEKLFSFAHAPMAMLFKNKIYLSYRKLISKEKSGISLKTDAIDDNSKEILIDIYKGNPYDGGYSDIGIINSEIFIMYYLGNTEREPYIKGCKLSLL